MMAIKIISHAWRTYKSRLVKILKEENLFQKFKDSQEDWKRFVTKCANQLTL
jgi:hypothetical protein